MCAGGEGKRGGEWDFLGTFAEQGRGILDLFFKLFSSAKLLDEDQLCLTTFYSLSLMASQA